MSGATTFYNDVEVRGIVSTSLAGKSIGTVTTMPAASSKNKDCAVLYIGASGTYIPGTIYRSTGSAWTAMGKVVTVDSAVTDGSSNPASGDAIVTYLTTNYQPKITGAASNALTANFTANRPVVSNNSGKIVASTKVTLSELESLAGVTSAVQTQLNAKADDSGTVHKTSDETIDGTKTFKRGSKWVAANYKIGTFPTKYVQNASPLLVDSDGESLGGIVADGDTTYKRVQLLCRNKFGDNVVRAEIGCTMTSNGVPYCVATETLDSHPDSAIVTKKYILDKLDAKQAKGDYVTAVDGKGLSENDYTSAEKTKLSGIATGAQVNVLEGVSVKSASGTTSLTPASKKVTIDLSNYATKSDVSSIPKFAIQVVTDLPTANISASTIYLKADTSGSGSNVYDEYIYVNNKWEVIGTTMTDLTGYSKKADTVSGLSISGRTITVTKGDGTTSTLTTQDNNTDTKVKQDNDTSATAYPILLKNGTGTGSVTNSVKFASAVTVAPSTGKVAATEFVGKLTGNASTATSATSAVSATKATQDGSGNVITDTYATKTAVNAKASKPVVKTNVSVAASLWKSDTSVAGYSYSAAVPISGMTANHIPIVTFLSAQSNSGNYCTVADSYAGGVRIWSKVNTAITLNSVVGILSE